ncbi:keratin-associated protein family [Trichomonas vaginalis G3]|uniref:keratin-associated protein family n=2 Tax=Trichomonas vaginalis (strain ATCC PRA-98 / G3) TaxID=412133 RepID=UPI0021E57A28|nr:keratin-associated protein family [Trichomonas vaginalis G3]KAI5516564.1 keratin-associated protein family [Trichomonas vaginalis G3]
MIKQQQLKAQSAQVLQTITYAIYAYNSKTAEQTQRLKYGDLEIVLKNDHFEFVCKGGAVISNIKEILFMNSKIKGITDDITSIPPEEQRYYALNAFPKVLKIGRFNLNEEFIEGFLNDIMKKVDKEYVDSELNKKANLVYVDEKDNEIKEKVEWYHEWTSETFKVKADTGWVSGCLDLKADKTYVDEKDNEIKEKVEWYHEWTSETFKVKADTGWVSGCLDLKADKTYVDEKDNEIKEKVEWYHEWTSETFKVKADTGWVSGCLDLKADKTYVDEKDNEIKEKVEWYHEWTSETFKVKADTGWVSGCLDLKADKTYVDENYAKKSEVNDVITSMKNEILQTLYPVGSIYTSMNSTNPATVLGFGTWKQIVDKFLYCARYSKQTGGSKKIKEANLPPHTHTGTTNFSGDHSHSLRDHPLYNSEYKAGNDVLSPSYNNGTT